MSDFELDSRLANNSVLVDQGPLSQVRLMNDERYPWLVLVPRVSGITEWLDLDGNQQDQLRSELNRCCRALKGTDGVEKINFATLGNIVPQLHFHVVGRHVGDPAWPAPVWGNGQPRPFDAAVLQERVAMWKERLGYSPQP
jgi:diadenosine tetraphosphate (Ap4A) HIT family hydrolase